MLDVGFAEVAIIGVVALIVIGPERLPDVARKVGRWVAKFQRFVKGVRSDVARELESGELKALIGDQRDQINELRGMVKDAQKDIEKSTSSVMKDAESSFSEIDDAIKDTVKDDSVGDSVKERPSEPPMSKPSIGSSDASSDATPKQSSN